MDDQVKQKLCWNCDARVDMGKESCPSCGVYLSSSPMLEESARAPFAMPRYTAQAVEPNTEEKVPPSTYKIDKNEEKPLAKEKPPIKEAVLTPVEDNIWRELIVPLGSLLCGMIFSLFSLMLLFFSHDGVLTLQWNATYWIYYFILSGPLLFFGWRSLNK